MASDVRSETLADLVRAKHKLTPTEALPIVRQIAAAIDGAHRKGVVHGRLSAASVQLSYESDAAPEVAIHDFGTQPDAGPLDDIYAFGALMFEMLTGKQPSRLYAAQLPTRWRRAIAKCLARDPQQRFLSAGAAVAALTRSVPVMTYRRLMTIAIALSVIVGAAIGGAIVLVRSLL